MSIFIAIISIYIFRTVKMKIVFMCVLAAGMVATGSSECTTMAAEMCKTEQIASLNFAGINKPQLCLAYRTYVTCLTQSGCFNDTRYTAMLEEYLRTSCDGHMLTASVLTMLLIFCVMLFN